MLDLRRRKRGDRILWCGRWEESEKWETGLRHSNAVKYKRWNVSDYGTFRRRLCVCGESIESWGEERQVGRAEEEGRSWGQSMEEAETSKHYGHDFILSSSTIAYPSLKFRVCLLYCCSIATLLASQPKDIPLTLMALKRFVNRCHYTHNEPMVQSNWAHIYQPPNKSTWST